LVAESSITFPAGMYAMCISRRKWIQLNWSY
jgi:hypothetical protein